MEDTSKDMKDRPEENDQNTRCMNWCFTELDSDSIGLEYDRPSDFVTSQWPVRPKIYVIYRILAAFALVIWVSGDMAYETIEFYQGQLWRWFVFASNWAFLILAFTSVIQAVTSVVFEYRTYWIMDPIYIRATPLVLKLQWVLFNVSCNAAFVVTTGYWAFIAFVSNAHHTNLMMGDMTYVKPLLTSDMSRLKHTANSIYVLADILIGATPIRIYHMFFTVFAGSLYVVFNALYFINNGSLILKTDESAKGGRGYYFMNWSQPVEAICTAVLGMILCMVSQLFLHGLYHLRTWLYRRWFPGGYGVDSELQNIIGSSPSYNTLQESYGDKVLPDKLR